MRLQEDKEWDEDVLEHVPDVRHCCNCDRELSPEEIDDCDAAQPEEYCSHACEMQEAARTCDNCGRLDTEQVICRDGEAGCVSCLTWREIMWRNAKRRPYYFLAGPDPGRLPPTMDLETARLKVDEERAKGYRTYLALGKIQIYPQY
jgi:hypothetical protein